MFDSTNERLICEIIFERPEKEFYLRELAEEADVSASTVSRLVDKLEEKDLIDVDRSGVRMGIRASGNEIFRDFKLAYNLQKLAETGIIRELDQKAFSESIILFGSYSRGEDRKDSDIDIAVVNGREVEIETREYEKYLDRKLNIHYLNLQEAKENFKETLANGIVLRGYLEI